ncbi:MAG: hypothetical protein E1N59_1745 [Puniceicoccaceae bacterium 5H]|nr:MAG: hypothetical protein E1N59_1745 [Puniceicoccaceae bacterium 5H]
MITDSLASAEGGPPDAPVHAAGPLDPPRLLNRVPFLLTVLGWLMAADYLLYAGGVGVSIGLLAVLAVFGIGLNRRAADRRRLPRWFWWLFAPSALIPLYRTDFSNIVTLLSLLVLASGATYYHEGTLSARIRHGFVAWAFPFFSLIACLLSLTAKSEDGTRRSGGWTALKIVGPALVLVFVFSLLLADASPLLLAGWQALGDALGGLSLPTDEHVLFWLVAGAVMCLWLLPWSPWSGRLPHLAGPPELDVATLRAQVLAVLVALNGLYLAVNASDLLYLGGRLELPAGTDYKAYVHAGVWNLTASVLLSAALLAGIFRLPRAAVSGRLTRGLGYLWCAQNALFLLHVARRNLLYVDWGGWTPKRVYVLMFLLLVAVGFGLLVWYIHRRKSFGWLVQRNLVAVFAVCFLNQFLDVRAFVAWRDLEQWRRGEMTLDAGFLLQLGYHRWWLIREALREPGEGDVERLLAAMKGSRRYRGAPAQVADELPWPAWTWLRASGRQWKGEAEASVAAWLEGEN